MIVKRERYTPTDIGPTPEDWAAPFLKDVSSLITNGFVGTATPYYTDQSGVRYLYGTNVRENTLDLTGVRFVTREFDEQESKTRLEAGDLLTVQSGHIGTTAVVPDSIAGANCHALIVTRLHKCKVEPHFLSQYLNSHIGRARMRGLEVGSTILHINTKDLKRFRIPLPPLHEQQKIAASLSTWDWAIELTEKLIAAKQKRKQALMQQLLTGKVRFKEFVKSSDRLKTPVGEMPTDWQKHRLNQIVRKVKRKNPDGETHVLTASGEHGLVDQREFFNRSVAGANLSAYYLLRNGEFAYNRSAMKGYPFGAIKRLDRYSQGVLSTLYICFGVGSENCDSNYLCHFFEARLLDSQLRGITQVGGRAHGLLNITDADFYSMSVVLPTVEEQQKIAAVLDTQDVEIGRLRSKLNSLKRQKKGLMQQLLTGKSRVSVPVEEPDGA